MCYGPIINHLCLKICPQFHVLQEHFWIGHCLAGPMLDGWKKDVQRKNISKAIMSCYLLEDVLCLRFLVYLVWLQAKAGARLYGYLPKTASLYSQYDTQSLWFNMLFPDFYQNVRILLMPDEYIKFTLVIYSQWYNIFDSKMMKSFFNCNLCQIQHTSQETYFLENKKPW